MIPLHLFCRFSFFFWLFLVVLLWTGTSIWSGTSGNAPLLSSLFTRPVPLEPIIVSQPHVLQKKNETSEPALPEPVAEEPVVEELWLALETGAKGGHGHIAPPEVTVHEDGSVAVFMAFTGTEGQTTSFLTEDRGGVSIDLHGHWENDPGYVTGIPEGALKKIQIYKHDGYLRVTGIVRSMDSLHKVRVLAHHKDSVFRIVFTDSP